MKWAGHTVRMKDGGMSKRSETKKQEGCRKRGRPQLRWEDCVKRDLRKAEEEEKWRQQANNRDQWKETTKVNNRYGPKRDTSLAEQPFNGESK